MVSVVFDLATPQQPEAVPGGYFDCHIRVCIRRPAGASFGYRICRTGCRGLIGNIGCRYLLRPVP